MKISILSPDLSNNCLGRAYILAKMLQKRYKVEIIGPTTGHIWEPVANDKSIKYKLIKLSGRFKPYLQIMRLVELIDGDIIYATKPLLTSFGVGLIKKFIEEKPLVLDIDDWELGFALEYMKTLNSYQYLRYLAASTLFFYRMGSYWNILINERLSRFANEITVSNSFLKKDLAVL